MGHRREGKDPCPSQLIWYSLFYNFKDRKTCDSDWHKLSFNRVWKTIKGLLGGGVFRHGEIWDFLGF